MSLMCFTPFIGLITVTHPALPVGSGEAQSAS